MTIQKLLKEKRAELGLTQQELAKMLGKNIQVYRAWEQARNTPSLENCKIISDKMGIDFNSLIMAKMEK